MISNYVSQKKTITLAFLGDSVTQGCFEIYKTGKESIETVFNYEEVYHNKLKKIFNMMYPSMPLNIINAGVSGNSASQGLSRIDEDVLKYHPDVVVVCFGLNDSVKGIENITEYSNALIEIFKKLRQTESQIIFLTPNMMATNISYKIEDEFILGIAKNIVNTQINGVMDSYMECAREVCKNYNIPVCDCYKIWKRLHGDGVDVTELLSNSLNHPTIHMHWLFAIKLFEVILNTI